MPGTRDRLVTATNELFRQRGYHGTSLKQITTAAGAPVGSLYHFFPGGKDELAEAAITEAGASYQALFELIADAATSPAAAVTNFFEGAAEVLEQSDYLDICPIGTVAREVASTNDTLRQATERVFRSWIESAASRFVSAGLTSAEAEELATTIIAALEGAFILARASHDSEAVRTTGHQMRRLVDASLTRAPVP